MGNKSNTPRERHVVVPCVLCGYFQASHADFNPDSLLAACPKYVPMDEANTDLFFREAKSKVWGVVGTSPFTFYTKKVNT